VTLTSWRTSSSCVHYNRPQASHLCRYFYSSAIRHAKAL